MNKLKLHFPQTKLAFAISLVLLALMPVQAQPVKPVIVVQHLPFNSIRQLSFNAPEPPNDINAPGDRVGGGKRGCEDIEKQLTGSKEKQLTALVPIYGSPDSGLVLGVTTVEHPTFWFYVPYSRALSASFILQDEAEQPVYETSVSLSGTPGIVSFSLPSTSPLLAIGKRYHWYFNVNCQEQQPPVFVNGWIKREELNTTLKSQLEKATPKQRVAIYAANGIWYEALTASAELSRIDAKRTDWGALLQAVGLDDIAKEPIVECCQPGD